MLISAGNKDAFLLSELFFIPTPAVHGAGDGAKRQKKKKEVLHPPQQLQQPRVVRPPP